MPFTTDLKGPGAGSLAAMQKREQHKPKTDKPFDATELDKIPMLPRYKCVLDPVDPQEVIAELTKERDTLRELATALTSIELTVDTAAQFWEAFNNLKNARG